MISFTPPLSAAENRRPSRRGNPQLVSASGLEIEREPTSAGDGTILFCNDRLPRMVGRRPEKLVGASVLFLVVPGEKDQFQQLLILFGCLGRTLRHSKVQPSSFAQL